MSAAAIIGCVVGVVSCIVGVATFAASMVSRAKQDGALMTKVDYLVASVNEIKKDTKAKNSSIDNMLDEHAKELVELKTRLRNLEKHVFNKEG